MAKKPVSSATSKKPVATPAAKVAPVSTPVRNSPVPKVAAKSVAGPKIAAKAEITHTQIAQRAYEIWASGTGGSEFDNWCRAERELRGL